MALFAFYGLDIDGGLDIRKATRPTHLDWITSLAPRVKIAGPMFGEDGATPVGSLIVIEAEDLTEARETFAQDPYARAGLWAHADIRPFNWLIRQ